MHEECLSANHVQSSRSVSPRLSKPEWSLYVGSGDGGAQIASLHSKAANLQFCLKFYHIIINFIIINCNSMTICINIL